MNNKRLNTLKTIQSVFENNPQRKWNFRQILKRIPFLVEEKEVKLLLKKLCLEKKIVLISPGSYTLNKNNSKEQGVVDKTSSGNAYIIRENVDKDIYVKEKNTLNSFDGDLVEFKQISKSEGIITKVLKRNKVKFVGVVVKEKKNIYVKTLTKRDNNTFLITNKKEFNVKDKDLVLIEFVKWEGHLPEAKIKERIGKSGVTENEMHAILEEFELPYKFNKDVLEEADKIKTKNYSKEITKRKDLRKITTLTIDPEDAKDFDDAISLELSKETKRVGVHIADVSYFLEKDSKLDKEAYNRGTSVYLVDRVVPMLPEQLSNELCSLKQNEDKFTFSIIIDFNNKNEILDFWAGRTVINSNIRLSYKEAQYIITNNTNSIPKEISLKHREFKVENKIKESLINLNNIAKNLRNKREKNGSIFFNKKEVRFILNKDNNPTDTFTKESTEANQLVEEFMLLANKKVAELFSKNKNYNSVYRVHDYPDDEKLSTLERIITKLGYKQKFHNTQDIHKTINKTLSLTRDSPEKNLIHTLLIRSMSKAKYSEKNIGHFGLNFEKYTHFTSPIRRYPDVIVHRVLQDILMDIKPSSNNYEQNCFHLSKREELATKAERSSIKFMQVKYMTTKINKTFLGTISGVIERGVFVEINKNKCEGFIKLKDIPGDYYIFNEKTMSVFGRHSKKEYQLGDEVRVKVLGADVLNRRIDFKLLEND